MRTLIKISIALIFILGSYYLGYYEANEKNSNQVKEAIGKLTIEKSNIQQLIDSIGIIKKQKNYIVHDTILIKAKKGK